MVGFMCFVSSTHDRSHTVRFLKFFRIFRVVLLFNYQGSLFFLDVFYRVNESYNITHIFIRQGVNLKKVYLPNLYILYTQLRTTYPHLSYVCTHIHILSLCSPQFMTNYPRCKSHNSVMLKSNQLLPLH